MLALKDAYEHLKRSENFEPKGFLCGVFLMAPFKTVEKGEWQFDFYDDKKDRITSYVVSEQVKVVNEESEVFKEGETKINEISIDEVEFPFEDAWKKAKNFLKDKHETANKVIIVVQKTEIPTWNISFITDNFNLVNIRMNAKNGKVVEEKVVSLLSF